jgi:hypothetical protein
MDVNFLGSGFSDPSTGKGGSGLYNGRTGVVTHATPWEPSRIALNGVLNLPEPNNIPETNHLKPLEISNVKSVDSIARERSKQSSKNDIKFPETDLQSPEILKTPEILHHETSNLLLQENSTSSSSINLPETNLRSPETHLKSPETRRKKVQNQKNTATPPYYYQEDLSNYTTTLINSSVNNYELCDGDFCCYVEISAVIYDTTVLRVIVFNGERAFGWGYYANCKVQTCGVIRCLNPDDPVTNCGHIMTGTAQKFTLNHIKISGSFSNDAILGPSIVSGDFGILNGEQITFAQQKGDVSTVYNLELNQPIMENILTFALWGRVFPKQQQVNENIQTLSYVVAGILGGVVVLAGIIAIFYHM